MSPPRVIQVASGREWRGGQRQVWLLARGLAREGGVEQVVVTGRGTELARRLRADGVPLSEPVWGAALDPRVLVRLLGLARRGHILHAHDSHALALACVAVRFRGARLVATRRVAFPLRRPRIWAAADRVIAVSGAVQRVLIEQGIPADRVCVVHSGVPVEEIGRTAPAERGAFALPRDARLAVSVGALDRDKDYATLIDAAVALRDRFPALHWLVAGEGPERPALERQLAARGIDDRVRLVGRLADPLPLLAAADLFVASPRAEGLGTSILDALALGVPVVATAVGGIPEVLGEGGGLLAPPEAPAALAAQVARVLEDRALAERLREQGRSAAAYWDERRMAAEVRSVYRSLDSAV